MNSKWRDEADFKQWLAMRISTVECKPAQTLTTENAHKLDPNIARMNSWQRERSWIYCWHETNARRPAHIGTTIPADWIDLVKTQPLQNVHASIIATQRVQAIRHTEQMSPVSRPVPVTDPIAKVTTPLIADQAEYRIASVSLRENMENATRNFYAKNKSMPSRIFLSPFNFAVAYTQNIVEEDELNGQPILSFCYADLFPIHVEEYDKLSDQTILCWQ